MLLLTDYLTRNGVTACSGWQLLEFINYVSRRKNDCRIWPNAEPKRQWGQQDYNTCQAVACLRIDIEAL